MSQLPTHRDPMAQIGEGGQPPGELSAKMSSPSNKQSSQRHDNIQTLPADCLCNIFMFMGRDSLGSAVFPVCRRFYHVGRSDVVWLLFCQRDSVLRYFFLNAPFLSCFNAPSTTENNRDDDEEEEEDGRDTYEGEQQLRKLDTFLALLEDVVDLRDKSNSNSDTHRQLLPADKGFSLPDQPSSSYRWRHPQISVQFERLLLSYLRGRGRGRNGGQSGTEGGVSASLASASTAATSSTTTTLKSTKDDDNDDDDHPASSVDIYTAIAQDVSPGQQLLTDFFDVLRQKSRQQQQQQTIDGTSSTSGIGSPTTDGDDDSSSSTENDKKYPFSHYYYYTLYKAFAFDEEVLADTDTNTEQVSTLPQDAYHEGEKDDSDVFIFFRQWDSHTAQLSAFREIFEGFRLHLLPTLQRYCFDAERSASISRLPLSVLNPRLGSFRSKNNNNDTSSHGTDDDDNGGAVSDNDYDNNDDNDGMDVMEQDEERRRHPLAMFLRKYYQYTRVEEDESRQQHRGHGDDDHHDPCEGEEEEEEEGGGDNWHAAPAAAAARRRRRRGGNTSSTPSNDNSGLLHHLLDHRDPQSLLFKHIGPLSRLQDERQEVKKSEGPRTYSFMPKTSPSLAWRVLPPSARALYKTGLMGQAHILGGWEFQNGLGWWTFFSLSVINNVLETRAKAALKRYEPMFAQYDALFKQMDHMAGMVRRACGASDEEKKCSNDSSTTCTPMLPSEEDEDTLQSDDKDGSPMRAATEEGKTADNDAPLPENGIGKKETSATLVEPAHTVRAKSLAFTPLQYLKYAQDTPIAQTSSTGGLPTMSLSVVGPRRNRHSNKEVQKVIENKMTLFADLEALMSPDSDSDTDDEVCSAASPPHTRKKRERGKEEAPKLELIDFVMSQHLKNQTASGQQPEFPEGSVYISCHLPPTGASPVHIYLAPSLEAYFSRWTQEVAMGRFSCKYGTYIDRFPNYGGDVWTGDFAVPPIFSATSRNPARMTAPRVGLSMSPLFIGCISLGQYVISYRLTMWYRWPTALGEDRRSSDESNLGSSSSRYDCPFPRKVKLLHRKWVIKNYKQQQQHREQQQTQSDWQHPSTETRERQSPPPPPPAKRGYIPSDNDDDDDEDNENEKHPSLHDANADDSQFDVSEIDGPGVVGCFPVLIGTSSFAGNGGFRGDSPTSTTRLQPQRRTAASASTSTTSTSATAATAPAAAAAAAAAQQKQQQATDAAATGTTALGDDKPQQKVRAWDNDEYWSQWSHAERHAIFNREEIMSDSTSFMREGRWSKECTVFQYRSCTVVPTLKGAVMSGSLRFVPIVRRGPDGGEEVEDMENTFEVPIGPIRLRCSLSN